jgi:diguanylate cyclase (GGDEF)-like protein
VDSSYILSTINPVVGFILSLTFYFIWKKHPEDTYILNWSVGFAAGSIGYAFEFFHFFIASFRFANGVNIFLPVGMLFTVRGICLRYAGRAPDRLLLSAITVAGIFGCWMSFGDHNALIRGLIVSSGVGVVMVVAMHAILKAPERDRIDLWIFLTILTLTIGLALRPLLSFLVEGAPRTDTIAVTSFWVVSLKVGGLFVWIAFALLFLLRIANDLLRELSEQTLTDALCGILNRRGFLEAAESIVRAATPKLPVSVLLLDIDHFKTVNDSYGHQTGDQVIRSIANVMRSNAPETAAIGRLGGEEFAIVLPNTSRSSALAFAEALRMNIDQQSHCGVPADHSITVSIGLAEGTSGSLQALLHDADMALYKAKNGGRNQVAMIGGEILGRHTMALRGGLSRSAR